MNRLMKVARPLVLGLAVTASLLAAPGGSAQAVAPAVVPVAPQVVIPLPAPTDANTDTGSGMWVGPVAYGAGGGLYVDFSKSVTVKNRKVQFQRWDGVTGKWAAVGKYVKMSSAGVAVLKAMPSLSISYRALALQTKYKKKVKLATPSKVAVSGWTQVRNYFDGNAAFDAEWTTRNDGRFDAKGRSCSAPNPLNRVVSGGTVSLLVSKEYNATTKAKAKAACDRSIRATRTYSSKQKKSLIKKTPIYRNAMMSTDRKYSAKTCIVAARIRFPKNVGMHSGVWLQSGAGSEIDMIESYGYGKGVTNVVHLNGHEYKLKSLKMKSKKWWSQYHVFSVEWTLTRVTFRIDGAVTASKALRTPNTNYFLVMSNLSSDWELGKIKDSQLKSARMSVDWVKVWATK